ncbi:MAG: hypothetical protein KJ587_19570 [Alphaproteobacteria bacterium]|nr:hypothetical protein [Alphaproteobacteria bacterium]
MKSGNLLQCVFDEAIAEAIADPIRNFGSGSMRYRERRNRLGEIRAGKSAAKESESDNFAER